ncbi:MAG: CoA-binding protein [Patescibacteria group bacterium]|nr:CoA-binding protein [Patescibacteria group bacterium]
MTTVAILGASDKEGRYSRIAQELLMEKGYDVVPIALRGDKVLGVPCYRSIEDVPRSIDTLTLYVGPTNLEQYVDQIVRSDIRRVIFNPGTESDAIEQRLRESGKEVVKACTIVMLKTDQFDD